MSFSSILFEKQGPVGIITLNRPDKFNSFNREMALSLQDKLDVCRDDQSVRAIVLTGAGKAFCAGQDLQEAININGPDINKIVAEHYNPIIAKLRSLEKPVVAAVNGVAAGAGANIALACDLVLASSESSFIQAFSKIGLVPDSGGTYFLPRLIGFQKASALMMLGDKVSAQEAQCMGMVYKVIDAQNLSGEALQIAKKLAEMPTVALGKTKMLLNESMANDLKNQLKRENQEQVKCSQTFDYNEGINAFLEKRKPAFKGE